jgi:inosine/xanthosine triphosphate pyrophosphatase family protein
VVLPVGDERTFAELPAEEKDRISHRGQAMRGFVRLLAERLGTGLVGA